MKKRYIPLLLVASCGIYLLAWNIGVSVYHPAVPPVDDARPNSMLEEITVREVSNIVMLRYRFIPVFWSLLGGDLTLYHTAFLTAIGVLTVYLLRRESWNK